MFSGESTVTTLEPPSGMPTAAQWFSFPLESFPKFVLSANVRWNPFVPYEAPENAAGSHTPVLGLAAAKEPGPKALPSTK